MIQYYTYTPPAKHTPSITVYVFDDHHPCIACVAWFPHTQESRSYRETRNIHEMKIQRLHQEGWEDWHTDRPKMITRILEYIRHHEK